MGWLRRAEQREAWEIDDHGSFDDIKAASKVRVANWPERLTQDYGPQREPVGPRGRVFCLLFERNRRDRVIFYAQRRTNYRPNENTAYRARLDKDHAHDANRRKLEEGATTKAKTDKDASSPRRESENNAAQLLADTAGSPEGINPA
jgi:hypothetical protein